LKKIFVLTSERSGSNLFRTLLDNHSQISFPIEPHIFHEVLVRKPFYIQEGHRYDFKKIKDDILKLVNYSYHNWSLSKDDLSLKDKTSLVSLISDTYEAKALKENKNIYGCKSFALYNHIYEILAELDDVYLIYLVRDPRDQILSWSKHKFRHFCFYDIIYEWKKENAAILEFINNTNRNIKIVKYEDLVTKTDEVMKSVSKYLDINFEIEMTRTNSQHQELAKNKLWQNLGNKINKQNINKYLNELSSKQIDMIESICEEEMNCLGYDFSSERKWRPTLLKSLIIEIERRINKIRFKNQNSYEALVRRNELNSMLSHKIVNDDILKIKDLDQSIYSRFYLIKLLVGIIAILFIGKKRTQKYLGFSLYH
jgi:hypothetical protein